LHKKADRGTATLIAKEGCAGSLLRGGNSRQQEYQKRDREERST